MLFKYILIQVFLHTMNLCQLIRSMFSDVRFLLFASFISICVGFLGSSETHEWSYI